MLADEPCPAHEFLHPPRSPPPVLALSGSSAICWSLGQAAPELGSNPNVSVSPQSSNVRRAAGEALQTRNDPPPSRTTSKSPHRTTTAISTPGSTRKEAVAGGVTSPRPSPNAASTSEAYYLNDAPTTVAARRICEGADRGRRSRRAQPPDASPGTPGLRGRDLDVSRRCRRGPGRPAGGHRGDPGGRAVRLRRDLRHPKDEQPGGHLAVGVAAPRRGQSDRGRHRGGRRRRHDEADLTRGARGPGRGKGADGCRGRLPCCSSKACASTSFVAK